MNARFVLLFFLLSSPAVAQTNIATVDSNSPSSEILSQTNQYLAIVRREEQIRAECIKGERAICGKVMKIFPDGLVVESGYTNLLRPPLVQSWHLPGTVVASRPANLVESHETGAVCVGLVFLADIPKARLSRVKLYDYVNVRAFPSGERTYSSVGDIHRTVRRFSLKVEDAVEYKLRMEQEQKQSSTEVK